MKSDTESNFLPDGRQWRWSAHSLEAAKKCERYYEYTQKMNLTALEENVHQRFGRTYADALEGYHKMRSEGDSFETARDVVVELALKGTADYWHDEELKLMRGSARYKTRANLIRSIIWYLEAYRDDPCKTVRLHNGKPAVELPFAFELTKEIMLRGRLDRIVEFNSEHYIQDQKTTSSTLGSYYFQRYSPDNQMSLYTIAAEVVWHSPVSGVMIDAAQIAVGFTRFGRGFTYRTKEQNAEWLRNTEHYIEKIWECNEKKDYPMRDTSCQMYGGCAFLEVCSKSPQVRQSYLDTKFVKQSVNPLESR